MKTFFNWLKDIIYDSIDYIIMILIVVSVVFIIGWRLDALFANDAIDIPHQNIIITKEDDVPKEPLIDNQDKLQTEVDADLPSAEPTDDDQPTDTNDLDTNVPDVPVVESPPPTTDVATISITIPPGSLPSKIGEILESNGLINNKKDFVNKSQELKLDTKLKSGNFKISKNLSLEEVIKIITK